MKDLKLKQIGCIAIFTLALSFMSAAQYKDFKISAKGDTINATLKNGDKTGKWVITQPELRGEPGFVEEGRYKKNFKDGYWRKYTIQGDLIALENYFLGGKDGTQQYYTWVGDLLRVENWKGYNPDTPFDTIAIYGAGNNEIVDLKIVKAEPYSVKQGEWKYYDPSTGQVIKTEEWELNNIKKPDAPKKEIVTTAKKDIPKTPQMLEWEKKNRGKKGAIRDGSTGL